MRRLRFSQYKHAIKLMIGMLSAAALLGTLASADDCKVTDANPEWVNPMTSFPENGLTFVNLTVRFRTNMIGQDRVLHRFYNGAPVGPVTGTALIS